MAGLISENTLLNGLNNQQKEAVEKDISSCTKVIAGAGTGKTEIIARRFLKIMLELRQHNVENPAHKILVITFTEKAAANMKERILSYGSSMITEASPQDLWISTFHGFCHKFLKQHSIEAGLIPDFSIASMKEQRQIYETLIQRILSQDSDALNKITQQVQDMGLPENTFADPHLTALNQIGNPEILLDEGFFLIEKIKSLGLSPQEFITKSVESNQGFSKVVASLPFGFPDEESFYLGWQKHLTDYLDDKTSLTKEIFDALATAKVIVDKNNARGKDKTKSWSHAAGFPDNLETILHAEINFTRIIGAIYGLYQEELLNNGLIDFNDLINLTITILQKRPDIQNFYQNFFQHIIVDEFQDTNANQLTLIKLLLKGRNPHITFVGDRKQSIYAFRHAQVENLDILHHYIETHYKTHYTPIQLLTNYRSTDAVIESVNRLTTGKMNLQEELHPQNQQPDTENHKYVATTILTGGHNAHSFYQGEARYIAQEILKLKKQDPSLQYKDIAILTLSNARMIILEKALKSLHIPSLKRQNNNFFEEPEIRNIIAFYRFIMNPNDEIALLRLLEVTLPDSILFKLLTQANQVLKKIPDSPDLKKTNLAEKLNILFQHDLFPELNMERLYIQQVETILSTAHFLRDRKKHLSLLDMFFHILTHIPLYQESTPSSAAKIETHFKIFEKILTDYIHNTPFQTVKNFLEEIENYQLDTSYQLPQIHTDDIDAVQLLTVHASKGLEYKAVFITSFKRSYTDQGNSLIYDMQFGDKKGFGLLVKNFQDKPSPKYLLYQQLWSKPKSFQEDQRLFYVAISRARQYLNIIGFENNCEDYTLNVTRNKKTIDINTLPLNNNPTQVQYQNAVFNLPHVISHKYHIPSQEPLKLSYSKIKTFQNCPLHYMLQYSVNFPENTTENLNSTLGKLFHNLINLGYMSGKTLNHDDLKHFLSVKGYQDPILQTTLIKMYIVWASSPFAPQSNSQRILHPERYFYFINERKPRNVIFDGYIDLVIEQNDKEVRLIDFKAVQKPVFQPHEYWLQLYIYKQALQYEGYKIKDSSIVYITPQEYSQFFFPPEEEAEYATRFPQLIDAITLFTGSASLEGISPQKKCFECCYTSIIAGLFSDAPLSD